MLSRERHERTGSRGGVSLLWMQENASRTRERGQTGRETGDQTGGSMRAQGQRREAEPAETIEMERTGQCRSQETGERGLETGKPGGRGTCWHRTLGLIQ